MAKRLDLMGVAEIAQRLGVSKQRVHRLATDHPDFPEPVAELTAGKIWMRQDIEKWAAAWDRRPGRRSSTAARRTSHENP